MTPQEVTNKPGRRKLSEELLFPYGSNALTPDREDIRRGFRATRLAYLVAAIVVAVLLITGGGPVPLMSTDFQPTTQTEAQDLP